MKEAVGELTEKRSRFLAYVRPVTTEEEALSFLGDLRKRHWDARHHVYAYRLRTGAARYSDDGEPAGTAGVPIMELLRQQELTDVVVVVVRYFGGVLLGTGGLLRAYCGAAQRGLEAAGVREMVPGHRYSLSCDYARYQGLLALINEFGSLTDSAFDEQITLRFFLPDTAREAFERRLLDLTAGALTPREEEAAFDAAGDFGDGFAEKRNF